MKLARRKRTTPDTVPADNKTVVWVRARGACEVCEVDLEDGHTAFSFHHRAPRRMGGSRDPLRHSPTNLLLLCGTGTTGCHGDIERNRSWAYARGYLVRMGLDSGEVPVRMHRAFWLLDHDGTVREVAA